MNNKVQSNRQGSTTTRRLFDRLLEDKFSFTIIVIATIFQVLLTVYLPVLIGQAVNYIVGPSQVNFQALSLLILKMLVVIGVTTLLQYLNPYLYNRMIYKMVSSLRQEALEKVHRLPLSFVDQQSTGDLVSRLTTDSDQLADGLVMVFNQFFVGILTIVFTLISMLWLDLLMVLLVVGLSPLSIIVARFISSRSYKMYQKQTRSRGELASFIEESVQQEEVIRLYNHHQTMNNDFINRNHTYADYSKWAIFYSALANPTTRFINALIYASVTFAGAVRIISGTFSVGELTTFLNYANQYMKPFNDISSVLSEIQASLACAERMFMLLDQKDEVETGQAVFDSEQLKGDIGFDQVDFAYVKTESLIENLSFNAEAGQTVAIVGPTGAGKSTLINLLMRFYDVDQGKIELDGTNIEVYTRASIRQQFGMVLQETWLKVGTVADNIAYANPNLSRVDIIRAAKAAKADRFIDMLPQGYDTYLDKAGAELSTGQQQLLSIARVFAAKPKMLILDEATSSIDTLTEVLIQKAFDQLMVNRTSFIIAHRLSTIQNADHILVLDKGHIIEHGNHKTLMQAKGFYYQLQMAHQSAGQFD
ncbi:ABC transporter ATP-binding protein [Eremococcus coleocola]|uniref:ABC transporter ATP-binding protein n=1 Tax=Eremococcus coleocola TaxID=88132 RepID=UPI0004267AEF|nr:ABC transporter ATP-binding protein [Eremococcus coleocola]